MILEIFGGVGSGKSVILNYLKEKYKAEIIGMDETAHELYRPGEKGFAAVRELLGDEVVAPDGTLDRKKMADILYREPELLDRLNGVIHPLVYQETEDRAKAFVRKAAEAGAPEPLVVIETALPKKEKSDIFAEVWYVYTPKEIRKLRLLHARESHLRLILKRYAHLSVKHRYFLFSRRPVLNPVKRMKHRLRIHRVCIVFQGVKILLVQNNLPVIIRP